MQSIIHIYIKNDFAKSKKKVIIQCGYSLNTNKIQKLSSFKSNENIYKREDGSYYVVSANKASSVTL